MANQEPWNKGKARTPDCHPERKHRAHGLCVSCYHVKYSTERYKKNPEYFSKYYREDRKRNPERWAMYAIKSSYGMTPEEYKKLYDSQEGSCAICKRVPKGPNPRSDKLHLDHDHATGKIRGLLCIKCNLALGALEDNQKFIANALAYIREHCDA